MHDDHRRAAGHAGGVHRQDSTDRFYEIMGVGKVYGPYHQVHRESRAGYGWRTASMRFWPSNSCSLGSTSGAAPELANCLATSMCREAQDFMGKRVPREPKQARARPLRLELEADEA